MLQGSILGPLLFLIYINDIVRIINSSIRLFADDTSLYIIVENPIQAATILNSDLSQIYTWASNWLVTFNPSKTESLLFSRKLFKPLHPTLYMNQQDIITVESYKHLGLTFTNDLSWHEHLNNIKTKAWHRINVMRKLKFQLSRKSLHIIYFSFIRPLLEYADVVWDNCTQYEANELEKIQHEAARIVSGATKLVSIDKLLKEVGWDTLSCRRKKHKQILFYKMINGLCPDYLSSLVPPTVGNNRAYRLRNASDYKYIRSNTQLYYNSFLPSVVRDWNELPHTTRNAPSISSFKRSLNSTPIGVPLFYPDGKRIGQIYHSRLRMECSSLNHHLFSKNIIDSRLCICGRPETTKYYLFECNRFNNLRQEMMQSISQLCEPTLNALLYGVTDLTDETNRQLFIIIQEYILRTKRFQ